MEEPPDCLLPPSVLNKALSRCSFCCCSFLPNKLCISNLKGSKFFPFVHNIIRKSIRRNVLAP